MSRIKRLIIGSLQVLILCSCASLMKGSKSSDEELIWAARSELANVKAGLGMYQAEDDASSYPPVSAITSHMDLIRTLSPYLSMPEPAEAAWMFVSYARAQPDTFVLLGRATDSNRTLMTVTPVAILPPLSTHPPPDDP